MFVSILTIFLLKGIKIYDSTFYHVKILKNDVMIATVKAVDYCKDQFLLKYKDLYYI